MTHLVLAAPLAGWATRLAELPDPAFAQGLVGDGVAIDPTSSELCAPCDGVVVSVHRAHHACTLRSDSGAEILLHIGIDSVELRGQGFEPCVRDGQRVWTRDPLIRFDLDLVARRARSLHTPVLLVGGDGFAVVERTVDREVAVGDFLLAIAQTAVQRASAGAAAAADEVAQRHVRLTAAHGLHARPAAAIARAARDYSGEVVVARGDRAASGKSTSALMALDARRGDDLAITVHGTDAEALASLLSALIAGERVTASGSASLASDPARAGEAARPAGIASAGDQRAPALAGGHDASRAAGSARVAAEDGRIAARAANGEVTDRAGGRDVSTVPGPRIAPGEEVVLVGVSAAAGVAFGRAVRIAETHDVSAAIARDGAGAATERARLADALAAVRDELAQTIKAAEGRGEAAAGEILSVQLDLIEDPELAAAAEREIAAGRSAAWAWQAALQALATTLGALGNPLLAERTGDVRDLQRRTLARLAGGAAPRVPAELPEGAVIVADELLPSELAALPAGRLAGLCMARGGATSHVAILASAMALPAVVALGDAALGVPDGAPILVDGDRATVCVFPAAATRAAVERAIAQRAARRTAERAAAHQPAHTTDDSAIAVLANLGRVGDAAAACDAGAEGCGLLRTEFLFLDRNTAPSEDEQAARYQAIADGLGGRPLVIRTLDAGSDKPLPYLPAAVREANPALGVRGVRLTLRHPELLRTQLRAILRVRPAGACRVLVPMIATLEELRAVRAMLDAERRALDAAPVPLGAMIELPAAALTAEVLAREAAFLSIGSNDLAQYALGIDRGHPDLAAALTVLHPGVLRLIASTVTGARVHRRGVSLCGGAAGEPLALPLLVGLGIDTLSVAPALVPRTKALIRGLSLARCRDTAHAALALDTSDAVRALVARTWPELADGDAPTDRPRARDHR